MAKSYVTKFTEYVKTCKDNLKTNLLVKGQDVTDSDTLDSLVNRVANITPPPAPSSTPVGYVRDSNLPDIDELFDTDTERSVNGGGYVACAYLVCYLYPYSSTENQQNITIYGSTTYPAKIVFGKSGREITSANTSAFNFVVNEDELYTLKDGRKVYLLKCYSNYKLDHQTSSGYGALYSISNLFVLEQIQDTVYGYTQQGKNYNYITQYLRLIPDQIYTGNKGRLTGAAYALRRKDSTVSLDGGIYVHSYNYLNIILPAGEFIVNGDILFNISSWSYVNILSEIYTCYGSYVIPSISQNSPNYGKTYISFQGVTSPGSSSYTPSNGLILDIEGSITIPECYQAVTKCTSGNANKEVYLPKNVHIPASIDTTISGAPSASYQFLTGSGVSTMCTLIQNLTLSPNAFGLNTNAVTLYFDHFYSLTATSLGNIVNNLADRTGMTANTVRFNKMQQTMLTGEQITTLQNKNWTVTFV